MSLNIILLNKVPQENEKETNGYQNLLNKRKREEGISTLLNKKRGLTRNQFLVEVKIFSTSRKGIVVTVMDILKIL